MADIRHATLTHLHAPPRHDQNGRPENAEKPPTKLVGGFPYRCTEESDSQRDFQVPQRGSGSDHREHCFTKQFVGDHIMLILDQFSE